MKQKNIVATLYLKDGHAVRSMTDFTPVDANVYRLCQLYNDSGVDKIIIFDLSTSDDEHEKNVNTIRNINRNIDIKVCAGGNINRLEDIKKLLFAGCLQVILNASKPSSIGLAEEASARFGKDRILLSINNVDFIFKNQDSIENTFHEALVLNPEILDALENLTNIPYVVELPDYNFDEIVRLLKREKIRGIAGPFINDTSTDIMKLKSSLLQEGINMYNFAPDLSWEDLKLNSDGMVPVIVQDYRTDEVLMLAYMNLPGVKQVAVFDTSFHQTLPATNFMYALPYEYYQKYGIRKYGFHGTSHKFVAREGAKLAGLDINNSKIITCHIGNGGSITAVLNGKSYDTSMGFSPVSEELSNAYFGGLRSTIGGIRLDEVARDAIAFHDAGFAAQVDGLLPNNGLYAFRKDGEKHAWNPETISTLQLATRLGSYKKFKEFTSLVDGKEAPIFSNT